MKHLVTMTLAAVIALQTWGVAFGMEGKQCATCGNGSAGLMSDKRADRLAKELNLSPEQKEKVAAILKESGERRKAEMRKNRESMNTARDEADRKISMTLTPEQAQKFEKLRAEQKAKTARKMEKQCHKEQCMQ